MAGRPRNPDPVASIDMPPQAIAEAIHLSIRRMPHSPVNVYIRHGSVYVLSQRYRICELWDMTYPDDFAGSYTRAVSAERIAGDIEALVGGMT